MANQRLIKEARVPGLGKGLPWACHVWHRLLLFFSFFGGRCLIPLKETSRDASRKQKFQAWQPWVDHRTRGLPLDHPARVPSTGILSGRTRPQGMCQNRGTPKSVVSFWFTFAIRKMMPSKDRRTDTHISRRPVFPAHPQGDNFES